MTDQEKILQLENELTTVYKSSSYRVGRVLTVIPRRMQRAFRYVRENGGQTIFKYPYYYLRHTKRSGSKNYAHWACLSSKGYEKELKSWFAGQTGETLDLAAPKNFNQKIQWLKLNGDIALETKLADKYAVREWVEQKIGEKYLIPLLGVWEDADHIDFKTLPDQFVLKANHGCGWNEIVKNKRDVDVKATRKLMQSWLTLNYAYCIGGLELQYEKIPPKIIAEEYIENQSGNLCDYKFFCFGGKVAYIRFITERFSNEPTKKLFFDPDWNLMDFTYESTVCKGSYPKPVNLKKMIEIAEVLSQELPFVRVDLYQLNDGTIKFSEMTFTPFSGVPHWNPPEYNAILGDLIRLPQAAQSIKQGCLAKKTAANFK